MYKKPTIKHQLLVQVISCIGCLFLLSIIEVKAESNVIEKTKQRSSLSNLYLHSFYNNAALRFYQYDFSYGQLAVKSSFQHDKEPVVMQYGSGFLLHSLHTEGYKILPNQRKIWGYATYKRETTYAIQGTESSDYAMLRPYVIADSVGGDMQQEEYLFSGGYAQQFGPYTFAVQMGYRALIAYREVDPRPKNTVGQLQLQIAGTLQLGAHHLLGGSIGLEKYNQDNSLKFYDDLKTIPLYHMTGLGMDYARFAGNNNNHSTQGYTYTTQLSIQPHHANGWGGKLEWQQASLEKVLNNSNNLPLHTLSKHHTTATIFYQHKGAKREWSTQWVGHYRKHTGKENVFGDPSSASYPLIATDKMYGLKKTDLEWSFLFTQKGRKKAIYAIQPYVRYENISEHYPSPFRKSAYKNAEVGITAQVQKSFQKGLLQCVAHFSQRKNITQTFVIEDLSPTNFRYSWLSHNFQTATGSKTQVELSTRYDWLIGHKQQTFYLKAAYKQGWYIEQIKTSNYSLHLGITI